MQVPLSPISCCVFAVEGLGKVMCYSGNGVSYWSQNLSTCFFI